MIKLPSGSSLGLSNQSRAMALLTYVVLGAAVFGGLYWAQSVVIPLALGILFTTIGAPLVRLIERTGVGRIASVVVLTTVVSAIALALGWLIYAQTTQLMVDLPEYQENVIAKTTSLRSLYRSRSREGWERMMSSVRQSLEEDHNATTADTTADTPAAPVAAGPPAAIASDNWWLPAITLVFSTLAQITGHVGLGLLVAIFLLVDREDARNRLIQLIGRGHITQTTKALDDAAHRISRFLTMQALINISYGLILTICLLALGVNYAALWGVLSVVLRYIPYIGGWLAGGFPVTLALAQFPSWWPALAIVAVVVLMELIINNFVEPALYGQSIGVSSVALIIAAAFWTFLWGPVGLILAGPLTVCLVVLGKYVPPLRFLDVLLGTRTPMQVDVLLYQRLLAKDEIETERIIDEAFEKSSAPDIFDRLVFPVATYAACDREQGMLTPEEEQQIFDALTDLMASNVDPHKGDWPSENGRPVRLLVVGARSRSGDRLGVTALTTTLHPAKYDLVFASDRMIGAEVADLAAEEEVDGVCINSVPPGGLSHTKYLCKRLRSRLPHVKLFAGHYTSDETDQTGWDKLPADVVAHSLQEMLHQLEAWRPVFDAKNASDAVEQGGEVDRPHPPQRAVHAARPK
jgi:predicted PurR-regulated permease PerM